ncbi:MAG: CDP-alcohol phosphatidyltransferase family protein [Christensenellaceae bacterium]
MKDEDRRKMIRIGVNGITTLRIVGTIGLLFLRPMSPLFLVVYTLTGLTDALDGWLARKTGTASEFGARLDSIADLLFYAVMLVGLLPVLWKMLPLAFWYAITVVLAVRLGSYLVAAIKYRRFASLHTYLNKGTGAMVFLLPYVLVRLKGVVYCWVACTLAFLASLEELIIHLSRKSYCPDVKSIYESIKEKNR